MELIVLDGYLYTFLVVSVLLIMVVGILFVTKNENKRLFFRRFSIILSLIFLLIFVIGFLATGNLMLHNLIGVITGLVLLTGSFFGKLKS